jgi:DNA-binding HxlR family transcriptional regulator
MNDKKEFYIVYKDWGFNDVYKNLIYSYILGWKGECYASNELLSHVLGCSVMTIQRKLKSLEDDGYIYRNFTKNNRVRYLGITKKKTPKSLTKSKSQHL